MEISNLSNGAVIISPNDMYQFGQDNWGKVVELVDRALEEGELKAPIDALLRHHFRDGVCSWAVIDITEAGPDGLIAKMMPVFPGAQLVEMWIHQLSSGGYATFS